MKTQNVKGYVRNTIRYPNIDRNVWQKILADKTKCVYYWSINKEGVCIRTLSEMPPFNMLPRCTGVCSGYQKGIGKAGVKY